MTKKTQIEYNVRIRVPSGDTSNISTVSDGRITIGTITLEEAELDDFVLALKEGVHEAKRLDTERKTAQPK